MEIKNTRLRYISARTASALTEALANLPFKVEIKGSPILADGKWYLWFVLPEIDKLNLNNIELED